MIIFYVQCEDLSSAWDSYEKARDYLFGEANRCNWQLITADRDDEAEREDAEMLGNYYLFQCDDASTIEAYILPTELNAKPYIELV